jgi:hypothetical protein
MMRLRQAELMILIWGSKGGENHQNGNLVKNLAQKRNRIKEPSQKGFDDAYRSHQTQNSAAPLARP